MRCCIWLSELTHQTEKFTAALVNVKLSGGSYLVAGKNLTAFTNGEEAAVQATGIVPFLLRSNFFRQ